MYVVHESEDHVHQLDQPYAYEWTYFDGLFFARLDIWRAGRGIRKVGVGGRCYQDRNFGVEPFHHIPGDWHWGRLHSDSKVFVYFSAQTGDLQEEEANPSPFHQVIVLDDGNVCQQSNDVLLSLRQASEQTSMPGLSIIVFFPISMCI